jgi:hypothetical protein
MNLLNGTTRVKLRSLAIFPDIDSIHFELYPYHYGPDQ